VYVEEVSKRFVFVSLGVEHFAKSFLDHGVSWNDSEQLDVPTSAAESLSAENTWPHQLSSVSHQATNVEDEEEDFAVKLVARQLICMYCD